jgi:hypothetical protein
MNKCDEKSAFGNAPDSDTHHDSVRNPREKHGSFEKRANGVSASSLASGCCRIKAYRRRDSRSDESRT